MTTDKEHETTEHHESSDGSTDVTKSEKEYTESLPDGSKSGDSSEDTDFASGGDPEDS
ncbi:hypothetical protein GCM10025867_00930 [Frondihabitans sucicola]|uniref:Uncharacterized protein n=1 Tax=Frondihabitans sucicola TaxID=1268041 RepID=A0ABN6XVD9_9MICO|nr:hypothetical protein [Frondihabitans sucicola]BDZ47852.1 hypothetical protein GCM10025867_00930 [Frondihabitans sucicola]